MDPVLFSLPEIILKDRGETDCAQPGYLSFSGFSPHYHKLFPASQEQLDIHESSERSLQTSHEIISQVGNFHPSVPHHVMIEPVSLRASTVGEMLQSNSNSDQRAITQSGTQVDLNQHPVQHLIPSMTGSIQPQIQAQDNPSPLKIQPLSPGAGCQPGWTPPLQGFIFTPGSPQDSCWINMSPVTSTPNSSFGSSPYVLAPISSPTEVWYSPCSPPLSWLVLSDVCPSWCSCPQTVPVLQPCSPDLASSRAAQQVSKQLKVTYAASGKAQNQEQAKSEEEQQKNRTPDKSRVPPGSLPSLDEEFLAECAFEEYMIQEGVEAKENEKEVENNSFLEYLDKLCSDEDFVKKVESALNIEYLESLLSADAEPIDLLVPEKQKQQGGSDLNPERPDSLLSLDPEPIDLLPLRELQQEALESILQLHLHPPSVDSNCEAPAAKETRPATSRAEETASLRRAKLLILDPQGSRTDRKPNHDGQDAPLSTKTGSEEGWTTCSPLLPSHLLDEPLPTDPTSNYHNPFNAMSPPYYDGSLFMDYSFNSSLQLLANVSPDTSLTSDLEAGDSDALGEVPAAIFTTGDVSEEASNLAETSQNLQDGPLPGDAPASESPSTSSVSGSPEDPHALPVKDPVPSFGGDLLTVSSSQLSSPPTLSVLAWKTLPRPLTPPPAQIREPEEQCSPQHMNPKSPRLEDYTVLALGNSSIVEDSHAGSCDALVDGDLSDVVPEKQPKVLEVSEELASSELGTGELAELERKCVETTVTPKQMAIKTREERTTKKKPNTTANTRRSHRLRGQMDKEKARQSSEFTIERAEERKPIENSIKKTATFTPEGDGVIYKNPKRRPSGGRQLSKREETTKTANATERREKEQHQKLLLEMQELKVEGGEQREASNPKGTTELGTENALLTQTAQEDKELDEGRVERKEDRIQMSSFVRRRTRSMTAEEEVQLTPPPATGAKIKRSVETERSQRKSASETEEQNEGDMKKSEREQQTLSVSSSMKGSRRDGEERRERANDANSTGCKTEDEVSGNCCPVSTPPSLQGPGGQRDTYSTKDSITGSSGGGALEREEENPNLTPAQCPRTQQQRKTVALSGGGADRRAERGDTAPLGETTGTKTCDFYSLRSHHQPNVSKGTGNRTRVEENEATRHPSDPKPGGDQTADVRGEEGRGKTEEAQRPGLVPSPMKRSRHERRASEDREESVQETARSAGIETAMISSSPVKRGRWKSKLAAIEKDEAETSACKPSAPATRSNTKAKDEKISDAAAGQGTFKSGKSSAMETRSSREGTLIPRFPCERQTRLSGKRLPTKYTDFILCKTHRPRRQLRR